MPKKFENKRGGRSLVGIILIICVLIAILVFFNTTSLEEIKQLFVTLGNGLVNILKALWDQIIMPVVNFFLTILGRVVHR